jgi:hypothetical protein
VGAGWPRDKTGKLANHKIGSIKPFSSLIAISLGSLQAGSDAACSLERLQPVLQYSS